MFLSLKAGQRSPESGCFSVLCCWLQSFPFYYPRETHLKVTCCQLAAGRMDGLVGRMDGWMDGRVKQWIVSHVNLWMFFLSLSPKAGQRSLYSCYMFSVFSVFWSHRASCCPILLSISSHCSQLMELLIGGTPGSWLTGCWPSFLSAVAERRVALLLYAFCHMATCVVSCHLWKQRRSLCLFSVGKSWNWRTCWPTNFSDVVDMLP